MALPFSHTFSTVGTNVSITVYDNGMKIGIGDKVVVTSPGNCFANDSGICTAEIYGETFSADQECSLTPKNLTSGKFVGPCVRMDAAGAGIYYGWWSDNGTSVLFKGAAGVHTNILLTSGALPSSLTNEKMTLRVVGTTITGLVNDVEAFTATDVTIAAGKPGIVGKNGNGGAAYIQSILADDAAAAGPSAISDLAVTRDDPDNVLDWTMDGTATGHEVARSSTGTGDPGADGNQNGWTNIATIGAVATYTDDAAVPAFYSVRWTDGVDTADWSNVADDVPVGAGTEETVIGRLATRGGVRRYSSTDSIRMGVEAYQNQADGGIDYVLYECTDADAVVTNRFVSAETLMRGNERTGVTDPLTGCLTGQQAPCRLYPTEYLMADLPVGPFDVVVSIIPVRGTGITLATQRHYNFKDGSNPTVETYLNEVSGSDANTGLSQAQARKTWQSAAAAGAVSNDVGLVRVNCIGVCKYNRIATTTSIYTSDKHWIETVGVPASGAEIGKDGDWANLPSFATAGSDKMRVCFAGPDLTLRGKLRTTVDGADFSLCYDHVPIKPHAPWDTGTDPWIGAFDEGATSLMFTSSNEPAETWLLGCTVSGLRQPIADSNVVARGCRFTTGYGVLVQMASNVALISCQVDEWRHSSDGVKGYFADVTSTHFEAADNGSGKLRVRVATGSSTANFATESANLVGASLYGIKVAGFANAGGNDDNYNVLGAGTDGSGRQYVDLDHAAFTEAAGNSVTIRPANISTGAEWADDIHGDIIKANSGANNTNCSLLDIRGFNNSTPRGLGLDCTAMTRIRIDGWFPGLSHPTVRNDDIGAAGSYVHVCIVNCSFNGSANFRSDSTTSGCEARNNVFDGLSASNLGTLESLWTFDYNHFTDAGDDIGTHSTTGALFLQGNDAGLLGDATLDPASDAVGTGTDLGVPSAWYQGDKGVLIPCLLGDFSIPAGGGGGGGGGGSGTSTLSLNVRATSFDGVCNMDGAQSVDILPGEETAQVIMTSLYAYISQAQEPGQFIVQSAADLGQDAGSTVAIYTAPYPESTFPVVVRLDGIRRPGLRGGNLTMSLSSNAQAMVAFRGDLRTL